MQRNLTGKVLEDFKNDRDWQCAFYEAEEGQYGPAYNLGRGPIEDVVKVIACDAGENDTSEWIAVVHLKDGRYAVMAAGCDYTGWDCQASGTMEYHSALGLATTDLTPEQAERLGFDHDAFRLRKIDYGIKELEEERKEIVKKQEELIRSLEWTKNCTAKFEIDLSWESAIKRSYTYKLHVMGDNIPTTSFNSLLVINGVTATIQESLQFSHDSDMGESAHFFTNSLAVFIELLKRAKFKKIEYDEDLLQVFTAVANYA